MQTTIILSKDFFTGLLRAAAHATPADFTVLALDVTAAGIEVTVEDSRPNAVSKPRVTMAEFARGGGGGGNV